jgi:lipoprotein-anchoring transpeptidase ErfK/SrfK
LGSAAAGSTTSPAANSLTAPGNTTGALGGLGSSAVSPATPPPAATPAAGGIPASASLPASPLNPSATGQPAAPPAAGASPSTPAASGKARDDLAAMMRSIQAKLDEGRLSEAHLELSQLYNNPLLTPEESQILTALLDQVAGTVVYSREHLLEAPYEVQPGDTLERIGQIYNVPGELLAKINGLRDPSQLQPGQKLKVVRGPFEGIVDLSRYELTLLVGGRYAGRFPVGVGSDHRLAEGTFFVREKKLNPAYSSPDRIVAGGDPSNPLGMRMLDLGNQVGIHGTDNPRSIGTAGGRGSISLGQRDIDDVYDILSVGSRITVRR